MAPVSGPPHAAEPLRAGVVDSATTWACSDQVFAVSLVTFGRVLPLDGEKLTALGLVSSEVQLVAAERAPSGVVREARASEASVVGAQAVSWAALESAAVFEARASARTCSERPRALTKCKVNSSCSKNKIRLNLHELKTLTKPLQPRSFYF